MKIDVSKLNDLKDTIYSEDIVFDAEKYVCHPPLLEVKSCHVDLTVHNYSEFIDVNVSLKAEVLLQCSYSLKSFDACIKAKDNLHFANEEGDEEFISYKGNLIEMDDYLFDLLSASVPASPKAPGATLPDSGKGYRILSEDELLKEKEEQGNSKFDALKDFDFDN